MPEIFDALDRYAADNGADDPEFYVVFKRAFRADRQYKVRCRGRRAESVKIRQVSLIYVEQRFAVRASDAFGLVRGDK